MIRSAIKDFRPAGLSMLILLLVLAVLACYGAAADGSCRACMKSDILSVDQTEGDDLNGSTYIEHPLMRLPLDVLLKEQEAGKELDRAVMPGGMMVEPPESYSLLDHLDYVPAERDQGRCGSCWVWASTGAVELDMAYRKGIMDRLSIQYFLSKFPGFRNGRSACCGGTQPWFADFYNSEGRLIPWSNHNAGWGGKYSDYLGLYYPPYTRWDCCQSANFGLCGNNYPPKMPADCMDTDPNYPVSSISTLIIPTHDDDYDGDVGKEEAIANIKGMLLSNKGVNFNFFLDDFGPFFKFWDDSPEDAVWIPSHGKSYQDGKNHGGHAVLCVGYDDADPNNRYWIMLNSWGAPANRPHGLFRVSMDMDYSYVFEEGINAFGWFTFDVEYQDDGRPPQTPGLPCGPKRGMVGRSYRYSTSSSDADGDMLTYAFDWGDGTTTTTSPVPCGTRASTYHAWASAGTYQIGVKAVDSKGESSEWIRASVDIV